MSTHNARLYIEDAIDNTTALARAATRHEVLRAIDVFDNCEGILRKLRWALEQIENAELEAKEETPDD